MIVGEAVHCRRSPIYLVVHVDRSDSHIFQMPKVYRMLVSLAAASRAGATHDVAWCTERPPTHLHSQLVLQVLQRCRLYCCMVPPSFLWASVAQARLCHAGRVCRGDPRLLGRCCRGGCWGGAACVAERYGTVYAAAGMPAFTRECILNPCQELLVLQL